MSVFHLHTWLFCSICFVLGITGYGWLIRAICRLLALAQREDQQRASFHSAFDESFKEQNKSSVLRSDSPALYAMLGGMAGLKPGETACIPNWPRSPLMLELREMAGANAPLQLVAYQSRMPGHPLFYDCEMMFEVTEVDGAFLLKCIRYESAKPEHLSGFATLWSEELERRGYVQAQRQMMATSVHDDPPAVSFHMNPITTSAPEFERANQLKHR